jgi:hypothetical protein
MRTRPQPDFVARKIGKTVTDENRRILTPTPDMYPLAQSVSALIQDIMIRCDNVSIVSLQDAY